MSKTYRINEFAKRLARSPGMVRRWDHEGVLTAKRLPSGHRYFDESDFRDKVARTGHARNRLHALDKAHRAAGRSVKADRIRSNNLGRIKLVSRCERAQQQLRSIAYQAAHSIVDQAAVVGSEDLTLPIRSKNQWREYNR